MHIRHNYAGPPGLRENYRHDLYKYAEPNGSAALTFN